MRFIRPMRPLLLLGAAATVFACDNAPTSDAVGLPSYSYASSHGNVHLAKTTTYNDSLITSQAVISRAGGRISVGRHELVVPRGAVRHPTRFTVTVETGDNVILDMHAVDVVTGATVSTFPVSLQVRLSYDGINVAPGEQRRFVVVWLQDDSAAGALVPVRTTRQPFEHYAIGWVNHFSKYAMGMN